MEPTPTITQKFNYDRIKTLALNVKEFIIDNTSSNCVNVKIIAQPGERGSIYFDFDDDSIIVVDRDYDTEYCTTNVDAMVECLKYAIKLFYSGETISCVNIQHMQFTSDLIQEGIYESKLVSMFPDLTVNLLQV